MKRAMLATLIASTSVLLSGCDGVHHDAIIVCWQETISDGVTVVGTGGSGGGTIWICEAS